MFDGFIGYSGDLEVTGSEHCLFNTRQKWLGKNDFAEIPAGINEVEDIMTILWDCDIGHIEKESDVDLVVLFELLITKLLALIYLKIQKKNHNKLQRYRNNKI